MHLGELADVICGPFGSAITNKDYQESGIPLIRITNISGDGYMDYSDIIYISEELGNSLSRTQVSAGDIVISQRGSLGQCAIVDDTFPKLNISANIIAIKNPKGISAEFIRNYILSAVGQTLLERASSGQVQQKITTQDIANLLIPNNCNEEKLISIIERGHTEYESGISQANEYLSGMSDYILRRLSIKKISYKKRLCCGVKFADVIADKTFSAEYYHPERMAAIHTLKSNMDITAYKLSDIVDFYRDLVNVTDNDDYLGLASVESQTGELSGIHEKAAGQAFIYKKGDVLYGRLRPYLNKVLFAEKSGVCSFINLLIRGIKYTYLLQVCQLLIENQTLPRADEAVNSFREQLPQIEAALQEAQLHVIPNNLAVIGAISFYKLTNATKYQHFLSWVKENSITRVPGLHMNDLIQIFDQIYENRPKSIFVSMQFSVETEDTYQTIKDVRDILKRENGLEIKLIKIDEHHDGYSDEIYHRIIDGIKESSLVIADLSFGNKNVHHEIGYAQGLAKKVLLLYKTRDGVPANSEIGSNISMHDQVRFRNQAELRPILLRKIREFFGIEVDD